MKLELTQNDMISCRLLRDSISSREETLEMIVPDTYPDIVQILDTYSFCCLTKRELTETGILLAGTIKTSILYLPEGKSSVERLEAEIPFQHLIESDKLEGNCSLQAKADAMFAETRTINSRKVLIRVDLKEQIRIWKPELRTINCGIQEEADLGIEQRTEHYQTAISRMPREKCFTVEEELNLQDGKNDMDRILSLQPHVYCAEARTMGSKVVIKGGIQIKLLCRRRSGELFQSEFDLPISQMLEIDEAGEGARYQTDLQLLNWQLGKLDEAGDRISVIFDLAAQAQMYTIATAAALTDAYGTKHPLELQYEKEQFSYLTDSVMRKAVRETMTTDEPVRLIHSSHVELGIGTVVEEEGTRKVKTPVFAVVFYQTEEGGFASASKKFDMIVQIDADPANQFSWSCELVQAEALMSAAGIELRFTAEFKLREQKTFEVSIIKEAELDEERTLHDESMPSLVLRYVRRDQSLWELAKRYGTTCKSICGANKLEEGKVPDDQMLLIPRGR